METGTAAIKVKAAVNVGTLSKLRPTDNLPHDRIFKTFCGIKNM